MRLPRDQTGRGRRANERTSERARLEDGRDDDVMLSYSKEKTSTKIQSATTVTTAFGSARASSFRRLLRRLLRFLRFLLRDLPPSHLRVRDHRVQQPLLRLRVVPYKATSGRSSKASAVVERRRGRGLKARDPGRRDTPGEKVLKDRRSPRRRGCTGTSVR